MRTRLAPVATAILLAATALLGPSGSPVMAAAKTTLIIPPRTYQVGTTSGQRAIPAGNYSEFHITVDESPWTNPATTDVRIGISVSYDNGATWQEVTHTDENTPPPWTIPAKYGGGFSSSVAIDAFYGGAIAPTNAQGWVYVEGAAVPLGQITVSLQ